MQFIPKSIRFRLTTWIAAAVAATISGCATARLASNWAPSAVLANGNAADWADKQAWSRMKDGLQLSVANDAGRLYVMAKFRANDPQWSRAAAMGGVMLRVVGPGKKTMSFRLPKGPEPSPRRGGPGWAPVAAPEGTPPRMEQMRAELEGKLVVTDIDKNDIPVPADGSQGPAAGFSDENGMCVYEFSVPLRDTAFGHYSLGANAGAGLNLTVTAGLSSDQRREMREQMGLPGGRPEGGEGPAGGFGGGERGRGGGPGRGGPQGGPPGGQSVGNPALSIAVRLATAP